jgi:hypothetical protein
MPLSSVACLALSYFFMLSHKPHEFRKNIVESKSVFLFSLQLLSETFLILRRIERDVITNVHRFSVKYPFFLSDLNETYLFSTDFLKLLKSRIS